MVEVSFVENAKFKLSYFEMSPKRCSVSTSSYFTEFSSSYQPSDDLCNSLVVASQMLCFARISPQVETGVIMQTLLWINNCIFMQSMCVTFSSSRVSSFIPEFFGCRVQSIPTYVFL